MDIESTSRAQIASSLQELLDVYERSGNTGTFRLTDDGRVFHIIPRDRAVLDVRITLPRTTRSLGATIEAILASVRHRTTKDVVLATGPVNLLVQSSVDLESQRERAGDVLSRALATTGRKLSWQLLHDFGTNRYYLNIHFVE